MCSCRFWIFAAAKKKASDEANCVIGGLFFDFVFFGVSAEFPLQASSSNAITRFCSAEANIASISFRQRRI